MQRRVEETSRFPFLPRAVWDGVVKYIGEEENERRPRKLQWELFQDGVTAVPEKGLASNLSLCHNTCLNRKISLLAD